MTQPFPVWVVHARALADRKTSCLEALRELGWESEWMEDHDPSDLGWSFWLRRVRNPRLTWGQISVYAKHQAVLETIARSKSEAFVLEDDPMFGEEFLDRFERCARELPNHWDMVFLGASCGLERQADEGTPRFAQTAISRSMSGFLVTPDAAQRLARALSERSVFLPIDHAVNALFLELKLRVFWSVPALIQNGSEQGQFSRSVTGGKWRALNPWRLLRW